MKKVLLAFVMASTLFVGCKKDEAKQEKKEEIGVHISVSDFDNSTINSFYKLEGGRSKIV